jgi:ankyrin repeat protein
MKQDNDPTLQQDLNNRLEQEVSRKHGYAEETRKFEIACLLNRGANPNASAEPLLNTLLKNNPDNPETLQLLINANAKVDMRGQGGLTPLHHAASLPNGKIKEHIMDKLLAARTNVSAQDNINAKDDNGNTPLMALAVSGAKLQAEGGNGQEIASCLNCVKKLINAGAKADIPNNSGQTAKDMWPDNRQFAETLERYNNNRFAQLRMPSRYL